MRGVAISADKLAAEVKKLVYAPLSSVCGYASSRPFCTWKALSF